MSVTNHVLWFYKKEHLIRNESTKIGKKNDEIKISSLKMVIKIPLEGHTRR